MPPERKKAERAQPKPGPLKEPIEQMLICDLTAPQNSGTQRIAYGNGCVRNIWGFRSRRRPCAGM